MPQNFKLKILTGKVFDTDRYLTGVVHFYRTLETLEVVLHFNNEKNILKVGKLG